MCLCFGVCVDVTSPIPVNITILNKYTTPISLELQFSIEGSRKGKYKGVLHVSGENSLPPIGARR